MFNVKQCETLCDHAVSRHGLWCSSSRRWRELPKVWTQTAARQQLQRHLWCLSRSFDVARFDSTSLKHLVTIGASRPPAGASSTARASMITTEDVRATRLAKSCIMFCLGDCQGRYWMAELALHRQMSSASCRNMERCIVTSFLVAWSCVASWALRRNGFSQCVPLGL